MDKILQSGDGDITISAPPLALPLPTHPCKESSNLFAIEAKEKSSC